MTSTLDHRHKISVGNEMLTPKELFTKEHKGLKKEGEEMVKNTAQSGTVVAALTATVAFAAAFTVPGGNNQDTGIPLLLGLPSFMVFVIFDAMAFFSSVTSMMVFRAILTSPTSEEDFAFVVPLKLIMGLIPLSFSTACTMAAYCTTLQIALSNQIKFITVLISVEAGFPIMFFVFMQLPFLVELWTNTFGNAHLPSPDKIADLFPRQPPLGVVRRLKQRFHLAIKSLLPKKDRAMDANDPKPSMV